MATKHKHTHADTMYNDNLDDYYQINFITMIQVLNSTMHYKIYWYLWTGFVYYALRFGGKL